MIKLENISKNYGKVSAISNLSLTLENTEIIGIVGPNGSGKSTLIKIISDLIKDFKGNLQFKGISQQQISVASESFGLPDYYTVNKALKIFANLKNAEDKQLEDIINKLGIRQYLDRRVSQLSQGNKQRLNIAICLLGNPAVIILDEPNNGLDPAGFIMLRNIIKELQSEGKTVILASHLLSELDMICNRFIFIKDGILLLDNSKEQILDDYQSLENAYVKIMN